MPKSIIDENLELLNSLGPLTGDAARLAHRLSIMNDRLQMAERDLRGLVPLSGEKYVDEIMEGLTGN